VVATCRSSSPPGRYVHSSNSVKLSKCHWSWPGWEANSPATRSTTPSQAGVDPLRGAGAAGGGLRVPRMTSGPSPWLTVVVLNRI